MILYNEPRQMRVVCIGEALCSSYPLITLEIQLIHFSEPCMSNVTAGGTPQNKLLLSLLFIFLKVFTVCQSSLKSFLPAVDTQEQQTVPYQQVHSIICYNTYVHNNNRVCYHCLYANKYPIYTVSDVILILIILLF